MHSVQQLVLAIPCKKLYHLSRRDITFEENSDIGNINIFAGKQYLSKVGIVLPFIFVFLIIESVAIFLYGFIEPFIKLYIFWITIGSTFIGGIIGMWAVFQYGVISDHIGQIAAENELYENQMGMLAKERTDLSHELNIIQQTSVDLKRDTLQIEEQTKDFENLIKDLDSIANEEKNIANVVEYVYKICKDLKLVVLETDRAYLLQTFYECAFRDEDERMNENEYESFLGRLSKKQRARFSSMTFSERASVDENGNHAIGISEFLNMIEEVLGNVDDILEEF